MRYQSLDYGSYQEFVDGPEWREIKDYYYKNYGKKRYWCVICRAHWRLILHKRSYQHLTLKSIKRQFFYIKPLVVLYLKRNMVYVCFPHNGEIHFEDDGSRVPLTRKALVKRERYVYWRYRWKKVGQLRPSDFLSLLGRLLGVYRV